MAVFALMTRTAAPRRLNIIADMDWVEDPSIRAAAAQLGFVPWSSENMKALLNAGELVAVFPEGLAAINKPFSERYRVRDFDWTRLLPAIELGVNIYTMSTVGCEEAIPNISHRKILKRYLACPHCQ
ncbi:unnamed protein product [Sphagnum jensenii]|uniref:Uncharacterized protein n=1 Tax=Sphagnum jensenii TaxID=128206 RepID=A0ABP0VDJ2_9BRYO